MPSMPLKIGSQNKKPAVKGCKKSATGEIIVPDYVNSIVSGSFQGCRNVTSIVIPAGVELIDDDSFDGCDSLESIVVADDNPIYFSKDGILYGSAGVNKWGNPIKQYLLFCPPRKISAEIDEATSIIKGQPFHECDSLQNIKLPNLSFIPDHFLDDCTNLRNIDISEIQTEIHPEHLFSHCHHIEHITFSDTQNFIEQNGLILSKDLSRLIMCLGNIQNIVIPATVSEIDSGVLDHFNRCQSVETDPNSPYFCMIDGILYNKDKTELIWCPPNQSKIILPDTVVNLPIESLNKCIHLCGIEISPNHLSLRSLNGAVFSKNMAKTLFIPAKLSKMIIPPMFYTKVFENCRYIGKIETADNITDYTIIDGVLYYHYQEDDALDLIVCSSEPTKIDIPANVTMISEGNLLPGAFRTAESLEEITVSRDNPIFFSRDGILYMRGEKRAKLIFCPPNKIEVDIPRFVNILGNEAFYRSKIQSIVIPKGITKIGHKCFAGCSELKEVILPQTLTSIGNKAFADCPKLTSITFPDRPIDYCADSFENVTFFNKNKNCIVHSDNEWLQI